MKDSERHWAMYGNLFTPPPGVDAGEAYGKALSLAVSLLIVMGLFGYLVG